MSNASVQIAVTANTQAAATNLNSLAGAMNNVSGAAASAVPATQQLATGMGMLKTAASALALGMVAQKVADYIKESALLAARIETLGVVLNVVGNNAGHGARC